MLASADLKWILVLIWAIWLSLVTIMNICEALMALKVLPSNFKFASSNWSLLLNVTGIYNTPRFIVVLLFVGAIVWEAAATVLLLLALVGRSLVLADLAFGLMMGLWGGFLIMSQFFRSFVVAPAIPEAHRSIYGVCLLSWLAMHIL
ncbi:MAG: hypothetical protein KIH69_019750 [Anaerolineae bacterium]|nr:hypothetical protein [Anaerolineae bacterium]